MDLWFKFYPKDWNGDHQLRMCSLAARGLWASCLEPMHTADPYGHLLINGHKPSMDELAKIATCRPREADYCLKELLQCGVASQTEDGVIYSRRMVRDGKRRMEGHLNGKRGGGNPKLQEAFIGKDEVPIKDKVTPPISPPIYLDTRSQKPEAKSTPKPKEQASEAPPVREFLTWFQDEYKKRRQGAAYFVVWAKHGAIVKSLLKLHAPDRLQKHAQILLTSNEEWIETTDRGIEVLAGKINWLEERLAAWEVRQHARA